VRQRATTVLALLSDAEALNEQREKQRRQYWCASLLLVASSLASPTMAVPHRAVSSDTAPTPTSNDIDEYEADRRSRSRAALGDSSTSGNTKGVSAADMERNKRVLSQLCRLESNRLCADCRQPPATWASLNLGVFLCQRCAGIHRGLGVHISQVRSTTLDAWTCTQVDFLSATGNAVANAHWEAQLPVGFQRPRAEDADGRPSVALEGFIRRKYDSKAYASRAEAWPPQALTDGAAGSSSSDDEEEEAVRHFRRPGPSAVREGAGHPGLRVQLRPTAPPPTPARALPSAPPLPRKPLPAMPAVPEAAPLAPAPRPFFEEDFGECAPACAAPPSPSSHLHPPPSFYGASREPMSFISTPNASPASMAAASVNGFSFPEALAPVASPPAVAPARSVFNDMFDLGLGASPPAAPPAAPAVDILQQLLCSPPTTSPVSFDSLFGPLPAPKATSALAAPRATPLPDLLGKPLLPLPLHSASPHLMRQPPGRYAQDAAPLGAMHPHMHSPLRPGVLLGATAANGVPSPSRGGPSPRTHDPFFALTGL